jgi:hypothetical protein
MAVVWLLRHLLWWRGGGATPAARPLTLRPAQERTVVLYKRIQKRLEVAAGRR